GSSHRYSVHRSTVCSAGDAFNQFKDASMSAPGAPPAQEGPHVVTLTGNNPIAQSVNSSTMTITNTTLPTHEFYPGQVVIQVTPTSPNTSNIDITGTGT